MMALAVQLLLLLALFSASRATTVQDLHLKYGAAEQVSVPGLVSWSATRDGVVAVRRAAAGVLLVEPLRQGDETVLHVFTDQGTVTYRIRVGDGDAAAVEPVDTQTFVDNLFSSSDFVRTAWDLDLEAPRGSRVRQARHGIFLDLPGSEARRTFEMVAQQSGLDRSRIDYLLLERRSHGVPAQGIGWDAALGDVQSGLPVALGAQLPVRGVSGAVHRGRLSVAALAGPDRNGDDLNPVDTRAWSGGVDAAFGDLNREGFSVAGGVRGRRSSRPFDRDRLQLANLSADWQPNESWLVSVAVASDLEHPAFFAAAQYDDRTWSATARTFVDQGVGFDIYDSEDPTSYVVAASLGRRLTGWLNLRGFGSYQTTNGDSVDSTRYSAGIGASLTPTETSAVNLEYYRSEGDLVLLGESGRVVEDHAAAFASAQLPYLGSAQLSAIGRREREPGEGERLDLQIDARVERPLPGGVTVGGRFFADTTRIEARARDRMRRVDVTRFGPIAEASVTRGRLSAGTSVGVRFSTPGPEDFVFAGAVRYLLADAHLLGVSAHLDEPFGGTGEREADLQLEYTLFFGAAKQTPAFGVLTPGRIAGVAFRDANRNGRYDAGEELLAGARVTLSNKESTVTDAEGRFAFSWVAPGLHTVSVDQASLEAGGTPTTLTRQEVRVTPFAEATASFGIFDLSTLNLFVFNDLNQDGEPQSNEPILDEAEGTLTHGGQAVVLKRGSGGILATDGIGVGEYFFDVDLLSLPPGYRRIDKEPRRIELGKNQVLTTGVAVRAMRSVSGRVLQDRNGDGLADAPARGAAGVTVRAGGIEAVTGEDGQYVLRNLPPGDLQVEIVAGGAGGGWVLGERSRVQLRLPDGPFSRQQIDLLLGGGRGGRDT